MKQWRRDKDGTNWNGTDERDDEREERAIYKNIALKNSKSEEFTSIF